MLKRLASVAAWFGRVGLAFTAVLAVYLFAPTSGLLNALLLVAIGVLGTWLGIRALRTFLKYATWRLRNRLLVTYLFIAVVPILLIAIFALRGGYALVNQLAANLITGELDRQIGALAQAGDSLIREGPERWDEEAPLVAQVLARGSDSTIEIFVQLPNRIVRYPATGTLPPEVAMRPPGQGIAILKGRPYLFYRQTAKTAGWIVAQPLTRGLLSSLGANLGRVDFPTPPPGRPTVARIVNAGPAAARSVPPAASRFDNEVGWFASVPIESWDAASEVKEVYIGVRTRISAVINAVFNRDTDIAQSGLKVELVIIAVIFFIVVWISFIIGGSIIRTITGAVHRLYEGTQHVTAGDFSYRIEVHGNDQLAELSHSFNRMTENVERLLAVAKEKERLQSELEIAREVQDQLYPRAVPQIATLRIAAVCRPARSVSGDYYDYISVPSTNVTGSQTALVIADVAGKGISAALLMATIQSGVRTEVQAAAESGAGVSTSQLVTRLNRLLYANTSAAKYATMCIGLYDDATGTLSYTNAGHLPPLVVRDSEVQRFDVNGTIVGAFPSMRYEESYLALKPGDLVVFFTDGVTEPENQFGEMFGEERLIDLLLRHMERTETQILDAVELAVREWTGSEELQDDLTLMVARRL